MTNGFAPNFQNREVSQPAEIDPVQRALFADASGAQFRELSIYPGNSMSSPLLPALSVSSNNNEMPAAGYALTSHPAYYQPNPYYFTPQSTMSYAQYPAYPQYQYPYYMPYQPYFLTSEYPVNQYINGTDYRQPVGPIPMPPSNKDQPSQPLPDKNQPPKIETTEPKKLSRDEQVAEAMYDKLNSIREKHGLHKLERSKKMELMALANSKKMKARHTVGHFAHRGWEIAAYAPRSPGETPEQTADRALRMWMHSPAHRRIALSSRIHEMGAGVAGAGDTMHFA